jgi:enoyl-CoA hydratase/carnithine racemase
MIDMPELADARLTLDDAGVATLTLARDDGNALTSGTGLIPDIVNTCDWINCNRAVGALVLTGGGLSGGNINGMRDTGADTSRGPFLWFAKGCAAGTRLAVAP